MKKVFVSLNLDEAARIRDMLKDAGFRAELTNEKLIGAWGGIQVDYSSMPTVWIYDDERADEADALVRDLLEPSRREPWVCPRCKEENGGAFTACPTCGYEREPEPEGEG